MPRHAIVRVTPESIVELLKSGERHFAVTKDALPDDAKFVRAFVDDREGSVCLVIESDEYDNFPRPMIPPFVRTPTIQPY